MQQSAQGPTRSSGALPVESLLPFSQTRSTESISALRTALNEAKEAETDSQPEDDHSDNGGDKPARRPKRARACIACRNMKIRCLPVEGQEACLGCSKVNRECVMPGPARKRQKTVHKVAELEKKINMLTDALVKQQSNPTPPNDSPANDRSNDTVSPVTRSDTVHSEPQSYDKSSSHPQPFQGPVLEKGKLPFGEHCLIPNPNFNNPYVDVIDRNLLDMDTATAIFEYYVSVMSPHFPTVAFPNFCKAADVRAHRPMLFLAVITVACPWSRPSLQQDLLAELNRQLSERVMFLGEKSIELVQAILIYTTYYARAHQAKDLAFNQYIHSAVVMCLDLGMGKKYAKRLDLPGIEESEIRRTWLACYYFASSVSILLRHPSLVRWSPYVDECVTFFESNKNTCTNDKWLCCLVNLMRIAEEVSLVFNMDDPTASISFADSKTQYHLKAFEKKLSAWRQTVPADVDRHVVEHISNSINVYIHEISIHTDHNVDDFRPDKAQPGDRAPSSRGFVTTMHIDALTACLDSCHRVLNSYLSFDIKVARTLPNLVIVWNTYALVALIKLHGVLNAPDSIFSNIFSPDLQVDYYLDATIVKLSEVCKDGRWPPAEAFSFLNKKLKSWHVHRKAPYLDFDSDLSRSQPETSDPSLASAADKLMRTLPDKMRLPETYGAQPQQYPIPQSQSQSQGQSQSQLANSNSILESQTSDLNMAYSAANYNLNWDDFNFSQDDMNTFDTYMNDAGWMGYII